MRSKEKGIYIEKNRVGKYRECLFFILSKEIKLKKHIDTYFYHKYIFNMKIEFDLYFFRSQV